MNRKLAILRGINVGGKRIMPMADLKALFQQLGFSNVSTYIQSGNVVFNSASENSKLADQIEKAIFEKFGFVVPVIIRSAPEIEEIIQTNPFYNQQVDVSKLHVTFLNKSPENNYVDALKNKVFGEDKFEIYDREIYIFCEGKYHQSKLTNNFFEKHLQVSATTRNWKTVLKICELLNKGL